MSSSIVVSKTIKKIIDFKINNVEQPYKCN